jgi:hypothetical protein
MTLTRRGLAGLALATVAVGPVFAADAPKTFPAKKMFPFLDLYLGIPPADRTRFTLAYYLRSNGKPATGVTLTLISAAGARSTIPVGADGRLLKTPSVADLKDGQIGIEKSDPAAKFQLSMEMQAVARMADVVPAADLAAAITQCKAAIKAKAGVIGCAAPQVEQVAFPGLTAGTAVFADGRTAALPLYKGMPAWNPATQAGVVSLKFARTPSRALLAGKK